MKLSTLLLVAVLAYLLLAPAPPEQLAPIRQARESFFGPAGGGAAAPPVSIVGPDRGPLLDGRSRFLV